MGRYLSTFEERGREAGGWLDDAGGGGAFECKSKGIGVLEHARTRTNGLGEKK